jgi:hypothetical protein
MISGGPSAGYDDADFNTVIPEAARRAEPGIGKMNYDL